MDAARWTQVQTLFDAALKRLPSERDAFLETACAGDPDLLAEVRSLLAADEDVHPLLQDQALDAMSLPIDLLPPGVLGSDERRIGVYRLVEEIGRGGMGAVFLAERADGEFEQQVALKLIPGGVRSDAIGRRFREERQILARLEHPNVARLLDGGLTDDGLPYFAMEYVDGVPIDAYCDERRLSIDDRLQLVQQVCHAVQYAHQNLVVHRDLKPSNILVTDGGTVKLLDFGIAKVLASDGEPSDRTMLTRTGRPVMTPAYAAPEQVRGEPPTLATDVYALGVLLYEVLVGARPYALDDLSPAAIERTVCETTPEAPSAHLAALSPPEATACAEARAARADTLRRRVRGDLDTICLKALRKEPERRYASAEQLADDLQRHLDGRPVTARPDTLGYRLSTFVRRHRTGVLTAAAVVVLVVGLVAFYTVRLAQERDVAQREAAKAEQVAAFLQDVFKSSDPSEARGDTVSVRTVLERGTERIDTELESQPDVQAQMLDVMGSVYLSLGRYDEAQKLLERSLALRRRLNGEAHADVATSMDHLALLHEQTGSYGEAEQLNRQALALRRKLHGDTHPDVAESLNRLAGLLMHKGAYEEAEPLYRQALAMRQGLLGEEHEEVATTMNDLALLLQHRGKFEEAEELVRRVLVLYHQHYGEKPHPNVAASLSILGMVLEKKGDYAAAEATYREALTVSRALHGDEPHPAIAAGSDNLASLLRIQGKYEAAEPLLREAHAIDRRLHGDAHPDVASSLHSLALLLEDMGRYDEAEQHFRETLRILRAVVGKEHPYVAVTMNNLGMLLLRQEDYDAAEPLLRQSLALRQTLYEEDHPSVATALHNVGTLLHRKGEHAEAERLLRQALALRRDIYGDDHPEVAASLDGLGRLLRDTGNNDEAVRLLRQALAILRASKGDDHRHTASVAHRLASALQATGDYAAAEALYQEALATLRAQLGDAHEAVRAVSADLATFYEAWGKPARAARYRAGSMSSGPAPDGS